MLLRNLQKKVIKLDKEETKNWSDLPVRHGANYVTKRVLEMDSTPELTRVGKQYTHVSALLGICPRRHLLAHIHSLERTKSVNASMRLVWALGRAAETHVRTQFIDAMQRMTIIGTWACKCGHTKRDGFYKDVPSCGKCRTKPTQYKECPLFDHDARITGSPDLLYARPDNGKVRVVECKSIKKDEFEKLTKPKADHVLQGMAYNELLRINGMPQDSSITVIYICKDYQFTSPYKEFEVERTGEHNDRLSMMWDSANVIASGIRNNAEGKRVTIPDRLSVCYTEEATTAKNCDCVGLCFSRD